MKRMLTALLGLIVLLSNYSRILYSVGINDRVHIISGCYAGKSGVVKNVYTSQGLLNTIAHLSINSPAVRSLLIDCFEVQGITENLEENIKNYHGTPPHDSNNEFTLNSLFHTLFQKGKKIYSLQLEEEHSQNPICYFKYEDWIAPVEDKENE